MRFTVLRRKLLHVSLWQSTSASTSKLYAYNTSIGNSTFNVSDARRRLFPDFLRAQNMVRVMEGKLYRKWPEGKRKLVRVSGSSSYGGFELPRVKLQLMYDGNPGKSILVRVSEGSSYRESTVSCSLIIKPPVPPSLQENPNLPRRRF